MSVLNKLQSHRKSFRSSIVCIFACFFVFSCQLTEQQSDKSLETNTDSILEQIENQSITNTANDFALPQVEMEVVTAVSPANSQEEEVEVFQLQVVEQTVVTPVKKDVPEIPTVEQTEEPAITQLPVEQAKQSTATTKPETKTEAKPETKSETATQQTKSRGTTTAPRNSKKDRITTRELLPTPMWVVVVTSTANEADAIRLSSQYWSLGYKSNYFWSPDYESTNEQIFKVFLGPFVSQAMAEQFVNEKNDPNYQIVYLQ
ncbi:MAG: SPOR domain-containing protein [Bacteroidales bacterium]|jgi:outer membrane biosynthesis protein TonB|nr:SPOR domain-containing protein [Bacteroidales bacterium]